MDAAHPDSLAEADASTRLTTRRGESAGDPLTPYDAVLLVSFGGPEGVQEVMPFLHRVTGGRVPAHRLQEVAGHYYERGGVSPINAENRRVIAALEAELARRGSGVPVLWGNRNADPDLPHALTEADRFGLRRVLTVLTSAFPSYSSCRVYREALAEALAHTGLTDSLVLDVLPPYGLTPAFLDTMALLTRQAVRDLAGDRAIPEAQITDRVHVMFVTHSIPEAMNCSSGPPQVPGRYRHAQQGACAAVLDHLAEAFGGPFDHQLAFCSRSGSPRDPWLEPDVNDALEAVAGRDVREVVLVPIGFVSDHMEVVYDLDEQAASTAAGLGLAMRRVPTVRDHPWFVAGLVDLLCARAERERGTPDLTRARYPGEARTAVLTSTCPPGCCRSPRGPGTAAVAEPPACGAAPEPPTVLEVTR